MRVAMILYELDRRGGVFAWQSRLVEYLSQELAQLTVFAQKIGPDEVVPAVVEAFEFSRPGPGLFGKLSYLVRENVRFYRTVRAAGSQLLFVHMAHEFILYMLPAILALRLPVLLWYAHGSVPWTLRAVERVVDRIITSTPEGLRLPTPKATVIGQGVDTELFSLLPEPFGDEILYVGRVSERKRLENLLEVLELLPEPISLRVVGPCITPADLDYDRRLRQQVYDRGLAERVRFEGFVPHPQLPRFHRQAFVHLSLSQTGSMDKTLLESLAMGCPVLTSNDAFRELLRERPQLWLDDTSAAAVAGRVLQLYEQREQTSREHLRGLVSGRHDAPRQVANIFRVLKEMTVAHPAGH